VDGNRFSQRAAAAAPTAAGTATITSASEMHSTSSKRPCNEHEQSAGQLATGCLKHWRQQNHL